MRHCEPISWHRTILQGSVCEQITRFVSVQKFPGIRDRCHGCVGTGVLCVAVVTAVEVSVAGMVMMFHSGPNYRVWVVGHAGKGGKALGFFGHIRSSL